MNDARGLHIFRAYPSRVYVKIDIRECVDQLRGDLPFRMDARYLLECMTVETERAKTLLGSQVAHSVSQYENLDPEEKTPRAE